MKKLKTKFIPAMFFCLALLILVFQIGCRVAQTQVNAPSLLVRTETPTPEIILPKVEPEPESNLGNVAGNSTREGDSRQDDDAAIHIDFEIKGIGIGTSEAKVLQKLGKPVQSKKGVVDVCGGGFQKTLRYPGLVFVLLSDGEGQDYSIISVDVTSSKWMTASVLKIGADAKNVEAAFDHPHNKRTDKGETVFFYSLKRHEGRAKLFFQNNQLTRVSWSLNFC